jgi:hypothetical protein
VIVLGSLAKLIYAKLLLLNGRSYISSRKLLLRILLEDGLGDDAEFKVSPVNVSDGGVPRNFGPKFWNEGHGNALHADFAVALNGSDGFEHQHFAHDLNREAVVVKHQISTGLSPFHLRRSCRVHS